MKSGFAVSVVLASAGYPGSYVKGKTVAVGSLPEGESIPFSSKIPPLSNLVVAGVYAFHAGTESSDNKVATSGGRVMVLSAYATTLEDALKLVYKGCEAVHFDGKMLRHDIAHR